MFNIGEAEQILALAKEGQEVYEQMVASGELKEYYTDVLDIVNTIKSVDEKVNAFGAKFGHDLPALKAKLEELIPKK